MQTLDFRKASWGHRLLYSTWSWVKPPMFRKPTLNARRRPRRTQKPTGMATVLVHFGGGVTGPRAGDVILYNSDKPGGSRAMVLDWTGCNNVDDMFELLVKVLTDDR